MRFSIVMVVVGLLGACKPGDKTPASMPVSSSTSLAPFAGTWQMSEFSEQGDSVGAFQLVATSDTSGWHTVVPNRSPIQRRVVAFGGDSVVNEIGPFESVLRPGVQVRTREVFHVRGDTLVGSIVAHYSLRGPDSLRQIRTKGIRRR